MRWIAFAIACSLSFNLNSLSAFFANSFNWTSPTFTNLIVFLATTFPSSFIFFPTILVPLTAILAVFNAGSLEHQCIPK